MEFVISRRTVCCASLLRLRRRVAWKGLNGANALAGAAVYTDTLEGVGLNKARFTGKGIRSDRRKSTGVIPRFLDPFDVTASHVSTRSPLHQSVANRVRYTPLPP